MIYRNTSLLFCLLLFVAFVQSCKVKELPPHEYVQWMHQEENGLHLSKSIGGFQFSIQYKSPEYIILQENKSDSVSRSLINTRIKELDGLQYYTLFIQGNSNEDMLKTAITDESEYYARLEYYASPAQDDMLLIENGDTLPCVLYHYERNYGLSPQSAIVLGFEKGQDFTTTDKQFIYNDRALNTGPVQFTIQATDINQIPTIRYVHD